MCCCSPYIATIVAGVLGIFQAFASLCWNVPLLVALSFNRTRTLAIAPVDVSQIDDAFVVYGITAVFAFMNVQLLIFSALMLKGNSALKTEWISAWFILVNFKTILYGFVGIYFFYKYGTVHHARLDAYFRLGALFSGIFFFWPSVNLVLSGMVCKRLRDIERYNASVPRGSSDITRSPCMNDIPPPPYTERSGNNQTSQNHNLNQNLSQNHNLNQNPIQNQIMQSTNSALITGWIDEPLLNFEEQEVPIEQRTISNDGEHQRH